jgi:hypothetical protein
MTDEQHAVPALSNVDDSYPVARSLLAKAAWAQRALSPWVRRWLRAPETAARSSLLSVAGNWQILKRISRQYETRAVYPPATQPVTFPLAGMPIVETPLAASETAPPAAAIQARGPFSRPFHSMDEFLQAIEAARDRNYAPLPEGELPIEQRAPQPPGPYSRPFHSLEDFLQAVEAAKERNYAPPSSGEQAKPASKPEPGPYSRAFKSFDEFVQAAEQARAQWNETWTPPAATEALPPAPPVARGKIRPVSHIEELPLRGEGSVTPVASSVEAAANAPAPEPQAAPTPQAVSAPPAAQPAAAPAAPSVQRQPLETQPTAEIKSSPETSDAATLPAPQAIAPQAPALQAASTASEPPATQPAQRRAVEAPTPIPPTSVTPPIEAAPVLIPAPAQSVVTSDREPGLPAAQPIPQALLQQAELPLARRRTVETPAPPASATPLPPAQAAPASATAQPTAAVEREPGEPAIQPEPHITPPASPPRSTPPARELPLAQRPSVQGQAETPPPTEAGGVTPPRPDEAAPSSTQSTVAIEREPGAPATQLEPQVIAPHAPAPRAMSPADGLPLARRPSAQRQIETPPQTEAASVTPPRPAESAPAAAQPTVVSEPAPDASAEQFTPQAIVPQIPQASSPAEEQRLAQSNQQLAVLRRSAKTPALEPAADRASPLPVKAAPAPQIPAAQAAPAAAIQGEPGLPAQPPASQPLALPTATPASELPLVEPLQRRVTEMPTAPTLPSEVAPPTRVTVRQTPVQQTPVQQTPAQQAATPPGQPMQRRAADVMTPTPPASVFPALPAETAPASIQPADAIERGPSAPTAPPTPQAIVPPTSAPISDLPHMRPSVEPMQREVNETAFPPLAPHGIVEPTAAHLSQPAVMLPDEGELRSGMAANTPPSTAPVLPAMPLVQRAMRNPVRRAATTDRAEVTEVSPSVELAERILARVTQPDRPATVRPIELPLFHPVVRERQPMPTEESRPAPSASRPARVPVSTAPRAAPAATIAPVAVIQRQVAEPPAPLADSGTIQRVETEPSTAAISSASPAETNLDDLARRIYPLIKRMLAVERERRPFR